MAAPGDTTLTGSALGLGEGLQLGPSLCALGGQQVPRQAAGQLSEVRPGARADDRTGWQWCGEAMLSISAG